MAGRVTEIYNVLDRDQLASDIANKWQSWNDRRRPWMEEKKELRNYIFATDTRKTANNVLPWKNSTTLPKICQIRDNLHANYRAALFPNDDWFKWEGYTEEDTDLAKRQAIEAYMKNKVRESGFVETISRLLYDYIDYGNVFADVEYINETDVDEVTGETIQGYVGPRAIRVSPIDIVFNPTAPTFKQTPKITRYIKTVGELKMEAEENPDKQWNLDVIKKIETVRQELAAFSANDINKIDAYLVDGFGDLSEYYQSGFVEIIEFEGSINDAVTGKFLKDYIITVVDRSYVARKIQNPRWMQGSAKVHSGWRLRPDNLYGMGPLDNLVGMQYRIDHLENLRADAEDLSILPPIGIRGNVEDFEWGPMERIDLGDDGEIIELGKNLGPVITAANDIAQYELKMEEMAGAPKQAMGIRTPGEKTAFEVQQLQNAAGRIFQDKVAQFEREIIEPLLNNMFEISKRNLDGADLIRVMDDDIGVVEFMNVTKEDITAKGKLRPVGARHFASQALLVQNLQGIFNSPVGQLVAPHVSSKAMASLIEEVFGLERFSLFSENVALFEEADRARMMNELQQQTQLTNMTPLEEEEEV